MDKKTWLPIIAIICFAFGSLLLLKSLEPHMEEHGADDHLHREIKVGDQVPDFTIHVHPNEKQKLSSKRFENKILLLNFWAKWCTACIHEMPSIQAVQNRFIKAHFEVITISVDDEPQKTIPYIVKKLNLNLTMAHDKNQKLSDWFDVHGIPFTVVLDHNRKVLLTKLGDKNWNTKKFRGQVKKWVTQLK